MSKRKILALLLAVAMICSLFVSPALAAEDAGEPVAISDNAGPLFTDIDGHWSESAINRWASYGIIQGDGDGTVRPNRTLKRDELATILARLLGLKATAPAGTFTDVPAGAWYADAVLKCAAAEIMLGDGAGHANPESPIDRQQAIVMVARALGAKASNSKSLNTFKDGDAVADWAAPYLAALTDMGILNGLPDGDGFVVAPEDNINRAGLFALLDKAIGQYVTTPTTVTVNDPNKFVVINTDAGEDVTVTGTTAGIVVGAGSADDVILDNATVGTLKVDAPVDIIIKKGSAVTDLDVNAAAKVENNGAVTNLNTNADDVTFDGNKPAAVNTAEDVEPAKDSKGNEVTTAPAPSTSSGSGSSGSRPSTKYDITVTATKVPGATVTVVQGDKQNADEEGNFQPIVFTITPDAQKGDVLPYTVKGHEMTWPAGNEDVEVEMERGENGELTYTFTPKAAGVYNIIPHVAQPITRAEMFIAKDAEGLAKMISYGYPEDDVTAEQLAETPWLFIGLEHNPEFSGSHDTVKEATLTANGKTINISGQTWYRHMGKYSSSYVNKKNDADGNNPIDQLGLDGSAYTFVLNINYESKYAKYELTCDYVKPGVNAEDLKTVTFKNGNGDTTYKGVKGEKFTVPAADALDGKYFTGWTYGETAVAAGDEITLDETNVTVTANYVDITTQTTATRPVGDPDNFDYSAKYTALGLALKNNVLTVDAKTLIGAETVANEIVKTEDGKDYVFYGVEYTNKPAGATHAVISYGKTLTTFDDVNDKVAVGETDSSDGGTSVYNGHLIDYLPVAYREDGVWNFFEDGSTFTRYIKWMKGDKVLGITKAVITLKVEPATFTVTFKGNGKTEEVKVDYNTELKAEQIPAVPAKAGYTGVWGDTSGKVLDNKEITATYTPIPYTLKYDLNGGEGTALEAATFTIEDEDLTAAAATGLTKQFCTFDGWAKDTFTVEAEAALDPAKLIEVADENAEITLSAVWKDVEVVTLTAVPYDFSCPEGTTQYITFTLKNGDEDFYVANDTVKECWFRAGRTADGEWTKDTGVKLYEGAINGEFPEMDKAHQLGWTVSRRATEDSTGYYRFVTEDGTVYEVTIEIPQAIANPDNVIWGDTQITADKPVTAIPVAVTNTLEETSTNDEDENA